MFESDQHEFDEEYAEISHPAPPPPPKPPAPASAAAPAMAAQSGQVAVHEPEPIVEEPEEEQHEQSEEATQEEFVDLFLEDLELPDMLRKQVREADGLQVVVRPAEVGSVVPPRVAHRYPDHCRVRGADLSPAFPGPGPDPGRDVHFDSVPDCFDPGRAPRSHREMPLQVRPIDRCA